MTLNTRQKAFIEAYTGNATEAAKRRGIATGQHIRKDKDYYNIQKSQRLYAQDSRNGKPQISLIESKGLYSGHR